MHRQLRIRIGILLLLLPGILPPVTAAAQGDSHPRLLFDAPMLAWLPDSIAVDSAKTYTWSRIENMGDLYHDLPPEVILASNYGLASIPALGMVVHLSADSLALLVKAKLVETALYLAETDSVFGSGDDLSAAIRLRSMLYAYDMAFAGVSPDTTQILLDEIRNYLREMTTDFVFTRGIYNPYCSNHSIAIGAALILAELCLRDDWIGDPLLVAARTLGEQLVDKGMNDLLGEDGSYAEGGLYLAWVFRMLVPTWEAMHRIDGFIPWDSDKIASALDWTAYQLLPRGSGYFLNRNDCSEISRPLSLHDTLWNWSQHCLSDARFARWLQDRITGSGGFSYGSFSDYPSVVLFRHAGELLTPEQSLSPDRYFPDQGLYVYRRGWPGDPVIDSYHFTIQASIFKGGHCQEDVGQFTLRAFGHTFAMDHGPGDNAAQTEGHNLPLVGGLGQHNAGSGIGTDGTMEFLVDRGFLRVLRADVEPAYDGHSPFNDPDYPLPGTDWSWGYDGGNPLDRAERWALLLPGQADEMPTLYLYDDFQKDTASHAYQWRLHYNEDLAISVGGDRYALSGDAGELIGRLLEPAPEAVSWGQDRFINDSPDPNAKVLMVNRQDVHGRWLWQLLPLGLGEPEPLSQIERFPAGVHAVSGEAPGRVRRLMAAWGDVLQTPDLYLSGRFGLIEEEAGATRCALVQGRELWHQGRLYVGLVPSGWVVADLDTVWLSSPDLAFEIYSPGASAVMAGDQPVPFTRVGDYLVRSDLTGSDGDPDNGASIQWQLSASPGAPLRLGLAGPGARRARLDIYDVRGRRVATLLDGPLAAGLGELIWHGRDAAGRRLASGLYFARLEADGHRVRARLLLLR